MTVVADRMERLAREVVACYEARISSVEQIIAATHETLETFRGEREEMRSRLRESLAKTASLRKRDFDAMMRGLLALQEQREERVKGMVRSYLAEQRTAARSLGEALAGRETNMVDVAARLRAFGVTQEARASELRSALAECRREQERVTSALGQLLSNGPSIRVMDLKATLKTIQPQQPTVREREMVRT